ncbi:MAG: protein kinase [Polyangiaceae bacterium]
MRDGGCPFSAGDSVGPYVVVRELGAGTFGWVLAATGGEPEKRVALKVLRPELGDTAGAVSRFVRRELEILKRVHAKAPVPEVVRAEHGEVLELGGVLVMVLEFVDGPSLADVMQRERVMDQGEVRGILADLARGLAAIHEAGGVHRDLKPENVRLRADGRAVILDLGIAKALWSTQQLTGSSQAPMTPLYASPEQLTGEEVGPPADLFALGLIAYEMLTGAVPLSGRTLAELIRARDEGRAPPVGTLGRKISADLSTLIERCLARTPSLRPRASEALAMLTGALADTAAPTEADALMLADTAAAPALSDPRALAETLPRAVLASGGGANRPETLGSNARDLPPSAPRARDGASRWVLAGAVLGGIALAVYAGSTWSLGRAPSPSATSQNTTTATATATATASASAMAMAIASTRGPSVTSASSASDSSASSASEPAASSGTAQAPRLQSSSNHKDPHLERTNPDE